MKPVINVIITDWAFHAEIYTHSDTVRELRPWTVDFHF